MATVTTESSLDSNHLIKAVNSASEKVTALHVAFLALCAYVLVIVFSTTDMDLLIGKGVNLPVAGVEVPIVLFFTTAPFLIVVVHFNLLLQLHLLSRILYAWDESLSTNDGIRSQRHLISIFLYNYYLVGGLTPLVQKFVATATTITLLVLPLASLLTLQARFLAYQSEAVTWVQRSAVWLDVALVLALWPMSMERRQRWWVYMHALVQSVSQHWPAWLWGLTAFVFIFFYPVYQVFLFSLARSKPEIPWTDLSLVVAIWLILGLLAYGFRSAVRRLSRGRLFAKVRIATTPTLGATGLLTTLLVGSLMPLILVGDGEKIDRPHALATHLLHSLRYLDLHERVLLARPARPEAIADLRGYDDSKRQAALRTLERIDLQQRSLRGANLASAFVPMADFRGAQLQNVIFWRAQLQGADLSNAELQGAHLADAELQGANFQGARLQGALLSGAQLQGANFEVADLQAAVLTHAKLQGAYLGGAQLAGAVLAGAHLEGTYLKDTKLVGANLRNTTIYTQPRHLRGLRLADVRNVRWPALSSRELNELRNKTSYRPWLTDQGKYAFINSLSEVTEPRLLPAEIESCLGNRNSQIRCKNLIPIEKFRQLLLPELEVLACQSRVVARGVLLRVIIEPTIGEDSSIRGLAERLQSRINRGFSNGKCPGLASLTTGEKRLLNYLVSLGERQSDILRRSPLPGAVESSK